MTNVTFFNPLFHVPLLILQPVYYLRTRQYSRSIATAPYMVNFQGCLFRSYPGKYQTLLDTGDGRAYRRIRKSLILEDLSIQNSSSFVHRLSDLYLTLCFSSLF